MKLFRQNLHPIQLKIFKTIFLSILFTSMFFLLTGCTKKNEPYVKTGFYFDTVVTITLYDTPDHQDLVNKRFEELFTLCEKYDNMFSRTKEGGDIYKINHANGEPVMVSPDTTKLLSKALDYCELTNGMVDITLAPVKDLWDFTPDAANNGVPDERLIESALTHVNYKQVQIDGNKVCLSDPDANIDLGFIAKGFIADELKSYLISDNVDNAVISLGGNIITLGEKSDGTPYKVGIQKPFGKEGEYITTVDSSDSIKGTFSSVVTSGIYERYFKQDNTIYHHILDGHTGYPVQNNLYSVTILSNSSVDADALSTTCMLIGLEESKSLIKSLNGEAQAIFITDTGEIIDTRKE